jgi:hypothetical protein
MPRSFTNIDSLYLVQLADDFDVHYPDEALIANRLLAIAENLQSLDERNMALMTASGGYAQGVADAEARIRRRSNVLTNPEGEDAKGASILEQINRRVAEGNLKKIAMGERALDDAPDKFNAPRRKAPAKPQAVPDVSLDLDFLRDL